MSLLKGIHYTSPLAYKFQTFCKLGPQVNKRFEIASRYVKNGERVLDLCAGTGDLKKFLPGGCTYRAIEGSTAFASTIEKKCIDCTILDLHDGMSGFNNTADTAVMIISLCQFRDTSVNSLLEDLKKISRRVVIVEDVLLRKTNMRGFIDKAMNYFCATDFYRPTELLTRIEFESLMRDHGYRYIQHDKRYAIGLYERADEK